MSDQIQRMPLNSTRLVIDGENIPFGAYQAIYHKITQKTERLFQTYHDAYEIGISNFSELHQRLEQGLKQYRIAGRHVEVSHELHEGQSRQFSSFEKFAISDTSTVCCTNNVVFELNFLIILPAEIPEAEDIPQRYKLTLSVESEDSQEEDVRMPAYIRALSQQESTILSLEYADYTVAMAIKSIVDNWVEALPTKKRNKTLIKLGARRLSLTNNWFDAVKTIPLFSGSYYLYSNDDLSNVKIGLTIITAIAIYNFMVHIYNFLIQKIEEGSLTLQEKTKIIITNGDRDRQSRRGRSVFVKIKFVIYIASLIAAIIVNLLSSKIYDSL